VRLRDPIDISLDSDVRCVARVVVHVGCRDVSMACNDPRASPSASLRFESITINFWPWAMFHSGLSFFAVGHRCKARLSQLTLAAFCILHQLTLKARLVTRLNWSMIEPASTVPSSPRGHLTRQDKVQDLHPTLHPIQNTIYTPSAVM